MAPTLRIQLLGPATIERDGQVMPEGAWRSRQEWRLLTILIIARGATLSCARLIEWLWPGADTEASLVTLRSVVSNLRSTLEPNAGRASRHYIDTRNGGYAWQRSEDAWVDIEVFLALTEAQSSTTPAQAEQALALYRGDLLEDEPDAPWALFLREQLRERFLVLVEIRAEDLLAAKHYSAAVDIARRGIVRSALREPLYRILMRAYAYLGDVAAALQSYERFRLLLAHDLGATPTSLTQTLHAAILRGEIGPEPVPDIAQRLRPRSQYIGSGRNLPAEHMSIVGRDVELAQIRGWLTGLSQNKGLVATIVGEPGIGKTRLLLEVGHEADRLGCQIILMRCGIPERSLSFAALTQPMRPLIRAAPEALLRQLPATALAQVAELLPALRERLPDLPTLPNLTPDAALNRITDGLVAITLGLARFAPIVLLIDDVHWADAALIATIGRLVRAIAHAPVLIVMTYRSEELVENSELHVLLRNLGRAMLVRPLLLGPLDSEATTALLIELGRVRSHAFPELARRLITQSGGNPLVLHVLLQALLEAHGTNSFVRLLPILDQETALPDLSRTSAVRDLLAERLERLSPMARALLEQMALLRRPVSLDLIEELAGEAGLGAADDLIKRHFIVEDADDKLIFAHELVRSVIAGAISGPQRRLHHRHIAAALAALSNDSAEIERHLALSGAG